MLTHPKERQKIITGSLAVKARLREGAEQMAGQVKRAALLQNETIIDLIERVETLEAQLKYIKNS